MADAFHLQIISPAKTVVDSYVAMTEIPGLEGDFGVLPGHAPTFSMLRPGVIAAHLGDGVIRRFFVVSGYAEVSPESCTILSDHVSDLADTSQTEAQEALAAARTALAGATNEADKMKAEQLIAAAEALVQAIAA